MTVEKATGTGLVPLADVEVLLARGGTPHATSLEDYVAYSWESRSDLLGARHSRKRDRVLLEWMSAAVLRVGHGARVLDVGCSYGNHLFMLNAMLGKVADVELVGVDLFDVAIRRANAFASVVDGYGNCSFQVADLSIGLPFEDESFDVVNLADVLEHLIDPRSALEELARIARPSATLVLSTPLKGSLFKRAAATANQVLRGRLYGVYYSGKGSELDARGKPIMETSAGLDHVSEMPLEEVERLCLTCGFRIEQRELMSVMSGSSWFDDHLVLLSSLLLLEALHERLGRTSWSHAALMRLRRK